MLWLPQRYTQIQNAGIDYLYGKHSSLVSARLSDLSTFQALDWREESEICGRFQRQAVCPLGFGRQKINAGFPEDKNPDAGSSFRKQKSWDGKPDFQWRRHTQKSLPKEVGPALLYIVIIFRLLLLSPSLPHDATACTPLN